MEDKEKTPTPKSVAPKVTPKKVEAYEPKPEVSKPEVSKPATPKVPKTSYAVVSGKSKDDVHLSKAVYKNMARKRSLTVHHIQRRLQEWGYFDAYLDKDGFYGDKTKKSVTEFQDRMGLPATGLMDAVTMEKLFEGDTNVIVYTS